jgi:hypothetical protein
MVRLGQVFVKINGGLHYFWRAVDYEDVVVENMRVGFQSCLHHVGFEVAGCYNKINTLHPRDGVDAALSPTASQCAKLVMLKSQEKREGIHEGN